MADPRLSCPVLRQERPTNGCLEACRGITEKSENMFRTNNLRLAVRALESPRMQAGVRGAGIALLAAALLLPKPPAATADAGANLAAAWTGTFAMQLRVAQSSKLPLLPTQRSITTSLLLVELQPGSRDGVMLQRHRVCDVSVDGGSGVRMLVPNRFVSSLPTRGYDATLSRTGGGWSYSADLGAEAIGFDPVASGGLLPLTADAPGVRDSDHDGQPGATVELKLPAFGRVQLFIAQRTHLVLVGREVSPGRISGEVDIHLLEQRTLGAKPGMFKRTPRVRPVSPQSGFSIIRVPEGASCGSISPIADEIFAGI